MLAHAKERFKVKKTFGDKLEDLGHELLDNLLFSPGSHLTEAEKKTWQGKLNMFLHGRTISIIMLLLLLGDMLLVMGGITLEIEYLHTKIIGLKSDIKDCTAQEGNYLNTTTSATYHPHYGDERIHNAELVLINCSITILCELSFGHALSGLSV